jgi:hypothetical protein
MCTVSELGPSTDQCDLRGDECRWAHSGREVECDGGDRRPHVRFEAPSSLSGPRMANGRDEPGHYGFNVPEEGQAADRRSTTPKSAGFFSPSDPSAASQRR